MKRLALISFLALMFILPAADSFAAGNQDGKNPSPAQGSAAAHVDPARTALLIMDYENDIVGMLPEESRGPLLERANALLKQARQAKIQVIYVVVRFRPGYPEINPQNKLFSGLKQSGRLVEGTSGADIDAKVAPQPGDIVVTKRRVGAFAATDLETILRSKNIDTLVLFGISTSGVVLSTVRWASDLDYSLVVVSDGCADFDPEVNRVLLEKVFPRQTAVLTSQDFLKAVAVKSAK